MRAMVSLLALSVVALTGCSTHVRTVHLVPNAQATDVYLDNKLILNNMCYKDVSCYNKVCTGCRNIKFKPIDQVSPALLDAKIKLESDSNMTLVAMGICPGQVEAILYCDDKVVDSTRARIRVIHASPDSPAMNVALVPLLRDACETDTQPVESVYPEFKELCFRDASVYNEFEPGEYALDARTVESGNAILKIPVMTFCEGTNYTIFIIGRCKDKSLAAMTTIDAQESEE